MTRFVIPIVVLLATLAPLPALAQDQAQIDHGKQVYAAQRCSLCHAIGGTGNAKGPLDNVGSKLGEDDLRLWIVDAVAMAKKAGAERKPAMKNFTNIPDEDLAALVAYLASLKS